MRRKIQHHMRNITDKLFILWSKNIWTFSTYSNISMLFSQGQPIKAAQRRKTSAPCSLMSLFPACCCGDGGAPSAVSRCLLLVRQRESSVSYYMIPTCTSVTCRQMFTLCCQSVSSPSWLSGVIMQEIELRESSQKNKQDLMWPGTRVLVWTQVSVMSHINVKESEALSYFYQI